MGYYQMMFSLSFILAPLIGTAIYENFGSIILWIGTFVLSLISAFIFYRLRKA
jgi:MFS family permease